MKDIKNILRELYMHLSIRQTGKTTLLMSGTDNYDKPFFVLVPNIQYGKKFLSNLNKNQSLISLEDLKKLKGTSNPLIIDQESNTMLFSMALDKISILEEEVNFKNKVLLTLTELTEMYQDDSHRMEKHIATRLKIPFWNFVEKLKYHKNTIELVQSILDNYKQYNEKFEKLKKNFDIKI